MSASREKKKRLNQPEVEAGQDVQAKKGLSKGMKKALIVVVSVVLVAAIVFLGMVSTGFFVKHTTAAVVGGHKLTPAMVNYFYGDAYRQLQESEMGQFLGMLIDPNTPLDEQEYYTEEFETWADYLMDAALKNAADAYAIYDEAVANGFALSEESLNTLEENISMLDAYAMIQGFTNGDAWLAGNYGNGCNLKNYREYAELTQLVGEYTGSVVEGFTYTQEQVDAYYAENAEDFDAVDYRMYSFTTDAEEPTEDDLKPLEEKAKAMAEASQGNEQAFLDLSVENADEDSKETFADESITLRENYIKEQTSEDYREWLFDEARQPGDTTYVAASNGTGYFVLYFVGESDHSFQLPNVRHILVSVTQDATDEDKVAAREEAEAILAEFQAGDATEEAFGKLADEKSDDRPEGGLYENVAPGQMVEPFEDWCYEEGRQTGDTGIVETSYGYHVMYFSGYGKVFQDFMVENTMLNNDYTAWREAATEGVEITTNAFPMRFTSK